MMRKLKWSALLALLLAALIPCAALAAQGDANIAREEDMRERFKDYIYGGCVCGDTLYLYGGEHFYTYHVGDADLEAVEFTLPEAGENEYRNLQRLFSDGEALYALCAVQHSDEDSYELRAAEIYPVEVGADAATFGDPVQLNIDKLAVSYGGEQTYFIQVNDVCFVDGYLMMYVYSDDGYGAVYALDIETGEGDFLEDVDEVRGIAAYGDQLLLISYDYDARVNKFSLYDPASESLSEACPPVEMQRSINGIAYSRESGRLFYMSEGYVMAAEDFDFDNAQRVAELSTSYYSDSSGQLLPGDYYVSIGYECTSIRSTAPDALPETRITVRGSGYSDSLMAAYYSFGNSHGDAAVVLDQSYYHPEEIIEAMMSRDSSVDIYMLSVSGAAYDALYNRGFMVELDNPEIVSAVEGMYPAIREVLTRDGDVVAIPVNLYGWTLGIDYQGFEKLGIAREDVPDNWPELLDLLPQLPDMLPESGNIRIFEDYINQDSARSQLMSSLLESWRIHWMAAEGEVTYDAPELVEMFEKIMEMDYEALGLPEGDDEDVVMYRMGGYDGEDRNYTLFEMNVGCTIGNFYSTAEPALMSVVPGEAGEVPLQLSVAFVNPFSENVELAQEFLVELLRNMGNRLAYNLSDALNEPVRNPYSLEWIEQNQEELEKLRESLETAEPVDVPDIEQQIADMEAMLENMETYSWDISAKDIEWYRTHADYLTVERYDFLQAADEDGELNSLSEQMMAGRVSPADFLKEVDRKVRMRAREGN